PVESCLRSRKTDPLQGRMDPNGCARGNHLGQDRRLIESALPFPRRMQWHRHNDIELLLPKPRISERGAKPFGDDVAQMNLVPVFEFMNQLPHHPAAVINRDRRLKMERLMRAIAAGKHAVDGAGERFGTFRAKWRHNSWRLRFAFGA
ncbi:MAG: hypothetical protein QOI34_964, partial [Verrucomicrobiota bacterium]